MVKTSRVKLMVQTVFGLLTKNNDKKAIFLYLSQFANYVDDTKT